MLFLGIDRWAHGFWMILRFPTPTTVYTVLFSAAVLADLQILQISLCRAQIRLVWMLLSGPRIRVQPRNCIQAKCPWLTCQLLCNPWANLLSFWSMKSSQQQTKLLIKKCQTAWFESRNWKKLRYVWLKYFDVQMFHVSKCFCWISTNLSSCCSYPPCHALMPPGCTGTSVNSKTTCLMKSSNYQTLNNYFVTFQTLP